MLYEIDGKFYILASNKFREVRVERNSKGEYGVKLIETSEPIEKTPQLRAKSNLISTEEAYMKKNKNKGIE